MITDPLDAAVMLYDFLTDHKLVDKWKKEVGYRFANQRSLTSNLAWLQGTWRKTIDLRRAVPWDEYEPLWNDRVNEKGIVCPVHAEYLAEFLGCGRDYINVVQAPKGSESEFSKLIDKYPEHKIVTDEVYYYEVR